MRLNYAKKVYGGPFPNSDVDDVKISILTHHGIITSGKEEFSQSDVEEVFERRIQQEQKFYKGFSQQELLEYEKQRTKNSDDGYGSIY